VRAESGGGTPPFVRVAYFGVLINSRVKSVKKRKYIGVESQSILLWFSFGLGFLVFWPLGFWFFGLGFLVFWPCSNR